MEDPLIGVFGGTFDPIHFGHINLALELKEKCNLAEVWFIPTNASPFRRGELTTPAHMRLEMVKHAIKGIQGFKVLDIEVRRDPPSFTIDTLNLLDLEYPNQKFVLMLSEDTYHHFSVWKDYKKIKERVKILVGSRKVHSKIGISTSIMEISATKIRDRINKNLYCGHLVSQEVLDFIYQNQLYSIKK